MLTISISLLLIGLILLLTEAMIPGFGLPGISGIVALLVSFIITMFYFPIAMALMIVFGEISAIALIIYMVYRILKRRQLINKLILNETLDQDKNEIGGLDYFLGKEGTTKTALRPYGSADFNGFVAEVCSDGNFILENKKVKVIKITNNKIVVKELSNSN